MNTESFKYKTEFWVGEAISKGMRRHQNANCFNCGWIGHLRKNYRQGIPRNNISSWNGKNRRIQPSGICRQCGKGQHWINEYRLKKRQIRQPDTNGKLLGILLQAPSQKWSSHSQSLWRTCLTKKIKSYRPLCKKPFCSGWWNRHGE